MLDIILKGQITAISPINISRKGQTDEERGLVMTLVPGSGGKMRVPHVPGETLKGLLRHSATDLASRAMGRNLTLPEFYMIAKGGIKQSGSESVADIVAAREFRRSNPVLGLFGAAAPGWLPGSIAVGPAMPESAEDIEIYLSDGARRDEFRLNPEILNRFSAADIETYQNYADGVKQRAALGKRIKEINREIKAIDKSTEEADKAKVADLKVERARLQAEEETSKQQDAGGVGNTVGRPLDFKRGIAPGSVLSSRIDVIEGTDEEVGLFFATLKELSNRCRIGGFRSIGYGLFKGEWSIEARSDQGADFEHVGSVSIAPERFELKSNHPVISGAVEAWRARAADPESFSIEKFL